MLGVQEGDIRKTKSLPLRGSRSQGHGRPWSSGCHPTESIGLVYIIETELRKSLFAVISFHRHRFQSIFFIISTGRTVSVPCAELFIMNGIFCLSGTALHYIRPGPIRSKCDIFRPAMWSLVLVVSCCSYCLPIFFGW